VLLLTAMQMWPGHIRCEAIFGTPKGALPRKWGFTLRPGEVALGVHRLNHGSRLGDQPVVLGFAAKRDWFPTRILGEEAKERVVDALADLLIQKTGAKR